MSANKPRNMVELYSQARQILARGLGMEPSEDAYAEHVVDLAVAYERERIAQQIRNRLRVLPSPDTSVRARALIELLEYVESRADLQPMAASRGEPRWQCASCGGWNTGASLEVPCSTCGA